MLKPEAVEQAVAAPHVCMGGPCYLTPMSPGSHNAPVFRPCRHLLLRLCALDLDTERMPPSLQFCANCGKEPTSYCRTCFQLW